MERICDDKVVRIKTIHARDVTAQDQIRFIVVQTLNLLLSTSGIVSGPTRFLPEKKTCYKEG